MKRIRVATVPRMQGQNHCALAEPRGQAFLSSGATPMLPQAAVTLLLSSSTRGRR